MHAATFKKIYNSYSIILEKGIYLVIIRLMMHAYCRFTELDCHGRRPYVEVLISLQQNILVRTKETLLVLTDVVPCGGWRAVLTNILSIAIQRE